MSDTLTLTPEQFLASPKQKALDALEVWMARNAEILDFPVTHRFTPGLYIREIFMFASKDPGKEHIVTSKIHLREHPFVISKGSCSVWTEEHGWVRHTAPYTGVTQPLTRRLLWIHEDTIWTTFHVTDKTSVEEVEKEILVSHNEREGLSEEEMSLLRQFQHCSDTELQKLEG